MLGSTLSSHAIMKTRFQRRLTALVAAMVLSGLGIVALTVRSQRQGSELRRQLSEMQSESFHIAEQFRSLLRGLDNSLYEFGRANIPADLAAFDHASHDLDIWIDDHKPKLATKREKDAMQKIDVAYDHYLENARKLVVHLQSLGKKAATVDDYSDVRTDSQRLVEFAEELARAHLDAKEQLLVQANRTIAEIRMLILGSLGSLFVFAGALGFVIYRDMIVPLRVKLVESESLRERQEKLASLGVLAAGVAHEIRNPLTAIKAALFIQQKKFQRGSQEEADAKVIDREILRLERIVNDFLLFARPSERHLALITTNTALREVHALLAPQLAKSRIQLTLEESPPLRITADEDQIKQVLINLVQNAAEAIGEKGAVKLRGRSGKKVIAGRETPVAVMEVEDNGKGIPPEVEKRLFDPFFTTKENGTGLGLSIAARIVHGHGGLLEYQTAPGIGTTFSIELPLAIGDSPQGAKD